MVKAATVKLNNGLEFPILGLGTYALNLPLSDGATEILGVTPSSDKASDRGNDGKCRESVEAAISCGYRHIDTAAFYNNEDEVGEGIKNMINKGTVKREEIFLTTKLWNDHHAKDAVVPALKQSLKRFGLEYVDLYLIHWPIAVGPDGESVDIDYIETWKGMEECLALGLTKTIGVSNFNIEQLERLLNNCVTVPAVNQVEINVNNTQKKLVAFCKSKGVHVTAYTPLGSMPSMRNSTIPPRIDDPILTEIANKYNKNTTQIVLRYLIETGVSAIPKSTTPQRIKDNIDIFDFALTPEEIKSIDAFNTDYRVVSVPFWKGYKNYPF